MATFRNATSASFNAASGTVSKPTGLAQNDLQLAFINADSGGATVSISGGATWTRIGSNLFNFNGDGQAVGLFWQIAGAAEPSTYTVTNNASSYTAVVLVAYSGADTASPIAAEGVTNPNLASPPSSPVSMATTAITTTAANQTVCWFGCVDWSIGGAPAFTDPSSTTRRVAETPGTLFANGICCDFVQVSQGSTGTITGTGTLATAVGNFVGWLVAIKDAAGGGGGGGTTALNEAGWYPMEQQTSPTAITVY